MYGLTTTVAALLAAALSTTAMGRPDFCEMGDAGEGPMTAQTTSGTGPLENLVGTLQGSPIIGSDFEDVFLIRVVDPAVFSATTFGDGSADFDAQLWLFFAEPGADGFGALCNDDTSGMPIEDARLGPVASDGTLTLTTPGLYYLAISAKGDNPVSSTGEIFEALDPFEISGPDGPGGSNPLIGWTQTTTGSGAYSIACVGVGFAVGDASIPTVSEWGLIVGGLVLLSAVTFVTRRLLFMRADEHGALIG